MFWTSKSILAETDNLLPKDKENVKEESVWYNARIKTNIGWIPWKDREASLFRLLERCFYARKMELHLLDSLQDFKIDIEVPASQEKRFLKLIVSKEFAREVDYLHGLDHILSRDDCQFLELNKLPDWETQTFGSGSLENLSSRISRLRDASEARQEELVALNNLVEFNKGILNQKLGSIMDATTAKFDAQCVSKMTTAEAFLAKAITRDLGFLAIKPPFGIQKKNKHLDRILQSLVIKQFVSRETQTMEFINPISESILNSKKDEIMQSAKSIEIPLSVNENNVGSSSDENLPGEEMSVEEFLRLREPKELDSNENVSSYFGNALLSNETINSEQGLKPQELQNADSESPIPTIPILVTEKEEEVVAIEQNKSEDPIETSSIHNQVDTATRGEYLDQNLSNENVIEAKSEESPLHNEMPTQPYPDIFEESETPRDIDPTHKVKEESLVVEAQNSTPEIPNPDVDEDNFEEFSQILPPLIDTVHEKKQAEDIHTAGDIATAKIPQFANVWSDNLNDDLQSIKNTNVLDSENIEDDENFMDDDLITPFKLDLNQRDSVAVTERRPYSVSSQAESRTDIPENAEIFGNRESFHSADMTPHAGSPIGDAQYNF